MGGDAGKSDKPRPVLISDKEWEYYWKKAFPSVSVVNHNDSGDENDYKQK